MTRDPAPPARPLSPAAHHRVRRRGRDRFLTPTFARRAAVAVVLLAALLVMFRPTWQRITHTLPVNPSDPTLISWILSWDNHILLNDPLRLFDSNMFWPHPLTLAYTEPILTLAPFFGLVHAVTDNWATSLNLTTMGLVFVSLAATYSLTRWLTGRTDAAVLAAIAFSLSSYTWTQLLRTQNLTLGLLPLAFLLLFRTLEERRLTTAVLAGLAGAAAVLGCLYYGAIWSVCAGIVVIGYLVAKRFRPGRGFVRCVAVVAGITAAFAVPLAVPYLELQKDPYFTRQLAPDWALKPPDLITPSPGSTLYRALDEAGLRRPLPGEHGYFLGFSTYALAGVGAGAAIVGAIGSRRRRRTKTDARPESVRGPDVDPLASRRVYLWLLLISGLVAFVLALGPSAGGHELPFLFFYDHVPGFSGLRVPARLAVPGLLAISVLAAIGFGFLTGRLRWWLRILFAAAVGSLMLFEFWAPLRVAELPTDRATLAVYHELTRRPSGPVLELPAVDLTHEAEKPFWSYVEGTRMVYSSVDWNPRFNGFSGYFPKGYLGQVTKLNTFPSRDAVGLMRELRIRYAILHVGSLYGYPQYTRAQVDAIVAALPPGASARRYGNAWLVDLGTERGSR